MADCSLEPVPTSPGQKPAGYGCSDDLPDKEEQDWTAGVGMTQIFDQLGSMDGFAGSGNAFNPEQAIL